MGELARIGIVGGKKVAVDGLVNADQLGCLDDFSLSCLKHYGFDDVAKKIAHKNTIGLKEITSIFLEASMPVLQKLIELRSKIPTQYKPTPVYQIPIGFWLKEYDKISACNRTCHLLQNVKHEKICVSFTGVNFAELKADHVRLFRDIAMSRHGLTLVGPAVEDLLSMISAEEGQSHSAIQIVKLLRVFGQLSKAGFRRLAPSAKPEMMKLLHQSGFPTGLITYFDSSGSLKDFAEELIYINEFSQESGPIDLWIPGILNKGTNPLSSAVMDLILLRCLGVGVLCLTGVTNFGVSSKFLSPEAIKFASYCGATSFEIQEELGQGLVSKFESGSPQKRNLV